MLRYSNRSFFDTVDERPRVALINTANVKEPDPFRITIEQIMNDSASEVDNGAKRFLTKEVTFTAFQTIYTLMQCTPDLSGDDCTRCLRDAIGRLSICCTGKLGGRVLFPSCNVRYEMYPFYYESTSNPTVVFPPPPSTRPPQMAESPPPLPAPGGGKQISRRTVAAKKYNVVRRENDGTESLEFDLITIETATKNFSTDYKLGEGGFGEVYKGIFHEGQEIAVKRLSKSSGQGEEEFRNEVALVAKLQHRNLVRLLGFCLGGGETLLVYEFVPNKSLDYFLFDPKTQGLLNWSTRSKIIGGIARGILYLHEDSRLRVIHRDLKASNVLLDKDMNPKISDFGMARMVGIDQIHGNTKRIVGTYGYMAPEYAMEGLYSIKSDVFSFGVLLLEILSGKKNSGFHLTKFAPSLLAYAWQLWNDGKGLELMDPSLKDSCPLNEFMRYVHIGLLCVQEDAYNRPTMSSIVQMLTTESISLRKPERPAFSVGKFTNGDHGSQGSGAEVCTQNNLTNSTFGPR
ncbi:Mitogen-activated protein kinase kinase kinase [Parasponia andersonii]|uniref:Mitogen-activated protein kinase kinase kinase n=1 Tax=Parasponia andersonii TaxID=3476 RepID=A0A2P5BGK7_PARAD|nr:Mitogen-activated protein kinase kinase kinase [Parasponia andersonii]